MSNFIWAGRWIRSGAVRRLSRLGLAVVSAAIALGLSGCEGSGQAPAEGAPTIKSVQPYALAFGANNVTLTGTNFVEPVTFNISPNPSGLTVTSYHVDSPTQISIGLVLDPASTA